MIYISPDNEYPRHIGDIQLTHPDFKEGDQIPDGWTHVAESAIPAVTDSELCYEDFPIEMDGVMTQNWIVRELTPDEYQMRHAPRTAKEKLMSLGLTEYEILALVSGLVR